MFTILTGLLAALVVVFGRFERPSTAPVAPAGTPALPLRVRRTLAIAGVVLIVAGTLGFAVTGLAGFTSKSTLLVVRVTPLGNLVRLLLGVGLVRLSAVTRRLHG